MIHKLFWVVKNITPYAYVSVLPVSTETLILGNVDLESELLVIFADAFAQNFHAGVLTGDGTGLNFKGLFTDILTSNKVECEAVGVPKVADLISLALQIKDFDDSAIVINLSIYAQILADTTVGVADVDKEELIRNKTIEGVNVILTGTAPSPISSGSTVAVAGKPSMKISKK